VGSSSVFVLVPSPIAEQTCQKSHIDIAIMWGSVKAAREIRVVLYGSLLLNVYSYERSENYMHRFMLYSVTRHSAHGVYSWTSFLRKDGDYFSNIN
jgi:hypothetical protein